MFQATMTPQQRHHEAADDGGVEAALGGYAGTDGDGHGQRQCNDRDRQPGHRIGLEIPKSIAFAQRGDELRREQLDEGRLSNPGRCLGNIHGGRLAAARWQSGRSAPPSQTRQMQGGCAVFWVPAVLRRPAPYVSKTAISRGFPAPSP
jgi:hypothetical protein